MIGRRLSRSKSAKTWLDVALFCTILLIALCAPYAAGGRSLGFYGWMVVLISTSIALLPFAAFGDTLFPFVGTKMFSSARYVALAFGFGLFVQYSVIPYLEEQLGWKEAISQSKIEYFCFENFDQQKCVYQVSLCWQCAVQLDKWKRDKMVDNLKAYRIYYPSETKTELRQRELSSSKSVGKSIK